MDHDTQGLASGGRRLRMTLPRKVDSQLAAEIEKESAYVSAHIRRLAVTHDGTAVDVDIDGTAEPSEAELRGKVERYLDAMLKRMRRIEPQVYASNKRRSTQPIMRGVSAALAERGWLFEHGPGFVSLAGLARRLAVAIDATLAKRYQAWFGAEESMFPAFLRSDVLSRCGYFESHPNAPLMATHLIDDFDAIEEFRLANEGQNVLQLPRKDVLAPPEVCLNPAACFPSYQALEGRRLDAGGKALTWQGRVFRYESRNTSGLDRLAEFNVRELVFLGSDSSVLERRKEVLTHLVELFSEWDLDCRIETASDPFFATISAAKMFWQESREVKYEMRLAVDPGSSEEPRFIACGSINLHEQFFGTRFNITAAGGEPASTGCVGVGIERWVLAIFSQHGLDPAGWPEPLRKAVSE